LFSRQLTSVIAAPNDLQRGGLAGAVGPEDPEELAALHLEADPVDGPDGAVRLPQVTHGYGRCHAGHDNRP
jgi:hypothetical protein